MPLDLTDPKVVKALEKAAEAAAQQDGVTLANLVKTRTRDEWCRLLEGTDTCFAPVLGMDEAPLHPHNAHRKTFVDVDGIVQPAPAPRFSRTPGSVGLPPPHPGQHTAEVLADWGFPDSDVAELRAAGAVR